MLRRRLPAADLTERHARVLEIEVGVVLSQHAGGLRLARGELVVGEHVARAKGLGALQRHAAHVRARPLSLQIRIAPGRARRSVSSARFLSIGGEAEGDDTQDAERREADPLHALFSTAWPWTRVYLFSQPGGVRGGADHQIPGSRR